MISLGRKGLSDGPVVPAFRQVMAKSDFGQACHLLIAGIHMRAIEDIAVAVRLFHQNMIMISLSVAVSSGFLVLHDDKPTISSAKFLVKDPYQVCDLPDIDSSFG